MNANSASLPFRRELSGALGQKRSRYALHSHIGIVPRGRTIPLHQAYSQHQWCTNRNSSVISETWFREMREIDPVSPRWSACIAPNRLDWLQLRQGYAGFAAPLCSVACSAGAVCSSTLSIDGFVMSKRTVQIKADSKVPLTPNVFGLRAFCEETILDTHLGPLPARDVTTMHSLRSLDGSFVGIEWIQRLQLDATTLKNYPDLKPVLLEVGQFGPNLPRRNMLVSRSHSLCAGDATDKVCQFGSAQMWCKHPDIFRDRSFDFTYIVIACERTTFINAEGLWFAS